MISRNFRDVTLGNGHQLGYAAADGALSFAVVGEGIPALQSATAMVAFQISQMRGPALGPEGLDPELASEPASLEEGLVGCKGGSASSPRVQLHEGAQGKHIFGHNNNTDPERSIFTHPDPQGLLDRFAGRGQSLNGTPVGELGSRERVNFGEEIGLFFDKKNGGVPVPTSNGIIHYGKIGAHIVPARP